MKLIITEALLLLSTLGKLITRILNKNVWMNGPKIIETQA